MKIGVIVDTNFLINNNGNIQSILGELKENEIALYLPELVKEEFINIQLRQMEETYNKLYSFNNMQKIINLKYRKKEDAIKMLEDTYRKKFEQNFNDNIINYNRENMLNRVLERNKYKKPPFYNENNSSDKGFKDTIILLTIIDFLKQHHDEAIFYFITSDNGFIKYKNDIESEIYKETNKKLKIFEGKDKNKLYQELHIFNEEEIETPKSENIFSKSQIDIVCIRKEINELMDKFVTITDFDYYGNPSDEKRFEISNYINVEKTEKFLDNIDKVIENNIFRNEILVELFFDMEEWVFSKNGIDIDTMKDISKLYKTVRDTQYKEAFVNYIMERINENKVSNMFSVEISDDKLPF